MTFLNICEILLCIVGFYPIDLDWILFKSRCVNCHKHSKQIPFISEVEIIVSLVYLEPVMRFFAFRLEQKISNVLGLVDHDGQHGNAALTPIQAKRRYQPSPKMTLSL